MFKLGLTHIFEASDSDPELVIVRGREKEVNP